MIPHNIQPAVAGNDERAGNDDLAWTRIAFSFSKDSPTNQRQRLVGQLIDQQNRVVHSWFASQDLEVGKC